MFIDWMTQDSEMSVLPKLISPNRFNAISIQIQQDFYVEIDMFILKFIYGNAQDLD